MGRRIESRLDFTEQTSRRATHVIGRNVRALHFEALLFVVLALFWKRRHLLTKV